MMLALTALWITSVLEKVLGIIGLEEDGVGRRRVGVARKGKEAEREEEGRVG
jgi:hypothetical protein